MKPYQIHRRGTEDVSSKPQLPGHRRPSPYPDSASVHVLNNKFRMLEVSTVSHLPVSLRAPTTFVPKDMQIKPDFRIFSSLHCTRNLSTVPKVSISTASYGCKTLELGYISMYHWNYQYHRHIGNSHEYQRKPTQTRTLGALSACP
jgi:hypothetical protein